MLIVIGDIHGCYDELCELLDRIGPGSDDTIVSVGDLVDRGPKSSHVAKFFRETPGARAILGNHEDKHIRSFDGQLRSALSQELCKHELGEEYPQLIDYVRELPLYLELPEALIVHAGYEPELELSAHPRNVFLRCKWPGDHGFGFGPSFWVTRYTGERPVVYGHSVFEQPHIVGRTFGIDTGACHGGQLTALILPAERLVSVRARDDYWTLAKAARRATQRPRDEIVAAALAALEIVLATLPPIDGPGGRRALGLALREHPLGAELTSLAFAPDRREALTRRFRSAEELTTAAARWLGQPDPRTS